MPTRLPGSILFLTIPLVCLAPAYGQTGTVVGRVLDVETAMPVTDVELGMVDAENRFSPVGRSNAWGRFRLSIAPGVHTLAFRRIGYRSRQVVVQVSGGSTRAMSVLLRPEPFRLDSVVVVSGTKEVEREAPGPIEVVNPRVERTSALVPTDYLRGRTGVDHATTGIFSATVVSRGFGQIFPTALLWITDHRYTSVPSLRANVATLMPVPSDDIERVEIMSGPGAVLYGPNAANGVIHILTRSPFSSAGTTVSLGGGEREMVFGSLRHAGIIGERFGYKITGQYMRGHEWHMTDPAERRARDYGLRRWTGELRADYRFGPATEASLVAGRAVAGRAIENSPFGAFQLADWRFDYYQARFTTGRLFVQAFANTSDAGTSFWFRSGQTVRDNSRLLAVQARHRSDLGDRQTFIAGIDYQHTTPKTFGTIHGRFEDEDESDEIGVYLHSKTRLSREVDLLLAGRYDHHSRVEKMVFSPRAGFVYRPSEQHGFRLTYHRAFVTPPNVVLFLDFLFGARPPYQIRALGAVDGLRFHRGCTGGLCVRSPLAADGEATADAVRLRDPEATRFWNAAAAAAGLNLQGIPAPTAQQVGTVLLLRGQPVSPAAVRDVEPIRPVFSHTFELGYNGDLFDRIRIAADVWRQRRVDFISTAAQQTPTMHLDPATLTAYLSDYRTPQQAQEEATKLAEVILGTAALDHRFASDHHIYYANRNFGTVGLWGGDMAVEALLTPRLTATGTWSWVSNDVFSTVDAFGAKTRIFLNAPRHKGAVGAKWSTESGVLSLSVRVRLVGGFWMESAALGQVRIRSHTTMDAGVSWLARSLHDALVTLQIQNVLDDTHREFLGFPEVGRIATARVAYTF